MGLIRNGAAVGSGRLEWMSVDYSAATDGLSARLSASIMKELIRDLPEGMKNNFLKVLAPHVCHYPDVPYKPEIEPVQQRNGQLMGSILSFPVLCLANLGLYLAITKEDPRPLSQRMKGVLVNGDDMLYCARTSIWERHISMGKKMGLEMSVGKAYHHPTVANANSMCFHYEIGKVGSVPQHIPYLNSGLFFGQGKVMGGDDETGSRSHVSVITELCRGFRGPRKNLYLGQYLKYHTEDLRRETEILCGKKKIHGNLFLPESVGGFGQIPVPGFSFVITPDQQRLARSILENNPFLKVKEEGDEDFSESFVQLSDDVRAPWLTPSRQDTVKRYPELGEKFLSKRKVRSGFIVTRTRRPGEHNYQSTEELLRSHRIDPRSDLEQESRIHDYATEHLRLSLFAASSHCTLEEQAKNSDTLRGKALEKLFHDHMENNLGPLWHKSNESVWSNTDYKWIVIQECLAQRWNAKNGTRIEGKDGSYRLNYSIAHICDGTCGHGRGESIEDCAAHLSNHGHLLVPNEDELLAYARDIVLQSI